MTKQEIKETLEKQLLMLSERSKDFPIPALTAASQQMVEIAYLLMRPEFWDSDE